MTQIKNKADIQDSIADELTISMKSLPNFFNNMHDEMAIHTGLVLSLLVHCSIALLLFILSFFGITFTKFNLPDLPKQDIEFKLVQQESKRPINKKTNIRSDRDSQAGGKHDPKKAISDPTPAGPKAKPKQAVKSEPKPQPQKQPAQQPKAQQKPAPQPKKQEPKPAQKPVVQKQQAPQKQVVKEQVQAPKAPSKPTAAKAPATTLKPAVKPSTQGVEKPTSPKIATAPKSPFVVPSQSGAPAGTTYKPAGTPSSGGASGGSSQGSGAPAPKFSGSSGSGGTSGGSKASSGTSGSSGSYGSRGSYGGGGSGGNPSPGNPKGTPGIDAIRQPNWGPYMRDLEQRIKRNWTPPKGDTSKRVVIMFTISRDGRLLNKSLVKSSGSPLADRAAMSAIEQTAPFRPLPPEFKGQSVPIEFTFDYNVLNSVMRK